MRHTLSEINELSKTGICSVCGLVKLHSRDPKSPKVKGRWACSKKRMESVRLRRLGMTPEQYNESLKKIQACEICGKSIEDNGRGLAIDHCHTTGNFRGMLCTNCNTALGLFHDDINTLKSAIKYLRK